MRKFTNYSSKRPHLTGDKHVDRALNSVYDEINKLIDSVNTPALASEISDRDGKPGDLRIVRDKSYNIGRNIGGSAYFIEAKTDEGWVRQYMDNVNHSGVSREGTIPLDMIKWETKKSIKQGSLSFWKSSSKFNPSATGTTNSDVYIDDNVVIGKNSAKTLSIQDGEGDGVLIKNDSGKLKIRNAADDDDADISLKDLTVGILTGNQTAIFNSGLSVKNGATGAGYIEFFEDSDRGTNKCTLVGQAEILDYTVTLPPVAGTLRTVETTPLVISYPFYFDDTTTGRTYFRDADDPNDIMSWDGFDTEDSTSVDDTATIVTVNAVSGVVVPYACTYVGAYFLGYQSSATAGEGIFQTWTGVPGDGTGSASTTVTLRTTNAISANRVSESFATSDVSISLTAGSMVYPAFQYVSGTSPKWQGNIALKFENITV